MAVSMSLLVRPPQQDINERFWSKVDKRGPEECWPWKAGTVPFGYGAFNIGPLKIDLNKSRNNRKVANSQRVAWFLTNGLIPKGKYVLHRCDNPPCCNPDHLFLGSKYDNIEDMNKKGRHAHHPGNTDPIKFTKEEIAKAVAECAASHGSMEDISKKYNMSRNHLCRLIKQAGVAKKQYRSKIPFGEAEKIRDLYATGKYRYCDIATTYGCTARHIGYIVTGKQD
jgi:hypothetical protein